MDHKDAISLIQNAFVRSDTPQLWADLGCGEGVFTHAIVDLFPKNSSVIAVDKNKQFFEKPITFLQADFSEKLPLPIASFDGIMMANSLHFVKDQDRCLADIVKLLKPNGRLVFVEYETNKSSTWGPYPLPFKKLKSTLENIKNWTFIEKIGERQSVYSSNKLYTLLAY